MKPRPGSEAHAGDGRLHAFCAAGKKDRPVKRGSRLEHIIDAHRTETAAGEMALGHLRLNALRNTDPKVNKAITLSTREDEGQGLRSRSERDIGSIEGERFGKPAQRSDVRDPRLVLRSPSCPG